MPLRGALGGALGTQGYWNVSSIVISTADGKHLEQFREWVENEWGVVDSFEGKVGGVLVPAPIFAVEENVLAGGIGFTSAAKPQSVETVLWINVLLVAPKYRHMGIGSQLVQAAEEVACQLDVKEMYVYTHIPELYQKLDWVLINDIDESVVLKKCWGR